MVLHVCVVEKMVFQKPVQLLHEHMKKIKQDSSVLYAVTLKANGEFVTGNIDADGQRCTWRDINGSSVVTTSWTFRLNNPIYGEYIKNENVVIIFDFDNINMTYEQRFNVLSHLTFLGILRLCDTYMPDHKDTFSCVQKFDCEKYASDGFVFTPRNVLVVNAQQFDTFPIYKWKKHNTVDREAHLFLGHVCFGILAFVYFIVVVDVIHVFSYRAGEDVVVRVVQDRAY